MTTKISSIELHKAINLALRDSYKVIEVKESNPTFPFIEIGEAIESDERTKTEDRPLFNVTLHTFTKDQNSIESKQVNEFVKRSILKLSNVSGFHVDYVKLTSIFTLKEEAEQKQIIFHGVLQFEIQLTSN